MEFASYQDTDLAESLLTLALKSGAEAAEVFQSQSISHPVFFETNRLKQLESLHSEGTVLRLWQQGRPGLAVAYGPVAPQQLVDRAIALSQLNEPEAIELHQNDKPHYADIGEAVSVEKLITWGQDTISQVRAEYPDCLCLGEWECEAESTRLINSTGLDIGYTDITLSSYLAAEWVRGDDFLSVAEEQTQRGTLDPDRLAAHIVQRLQWAEQNAPTPEGRVPVVFTAKAADMLWGTLQAALNGKQVLEKASPWSDRRGTPVTSSALTLSQHPERGPFSCPFDDEGTPTRPLVFIQNGVLQAFYTDRTLGRLLGQGTTGNGFRPNLSSYPSPGLFNLLVEPGQQSLTDLITSLKFGLVVDQVLGGSAGISGDFSINVDLGYRIEQGQIIGRVKDTMVSGNVYTALKNLVELGSDAFWNGACYTPSLIVEGLSITGRRN
jgi:PmbA protein